MTWVRYGQAALIAAIMTLTGNTVWAQQAQPRYIRFTKMIGCCKDGKCCKDGDCCANSKKCETSCTCCKDNKCECCKGNECGCDKSGKCGCAKDKTASAKAGCGCPLLSMLAKRTAIIMVMPASMPLPACCMGAMGAMGAMPHPPLPPGPHVFLPPMPIPVPHVEQAYGYDEAGRFICGSGVNSNTNLIGGIVPGGPPVVACCNGAPAAAAITRIITTSSGDQLEMSIGRETSIRCKKMTLTIGDNEITVSRFDDRVRVRGENLKATADCVCTEGKDHLVLEGNVVLHCKKDGRSANVVADCVGLDLSNGTVAIKSNAKTPSSPAVRIENVDTDNK